MFNLPYAKNLFKLWSCDGFLDAEKYCWGENLAGSSGLTSPNWSCAQEEQLLPTNFTPNVSLP